MSGDSIVRSNDPIAAALAQANAAVAQSNVLKVNIAAPVYGALLAERLSYNRHVAITNRRIELNLEGNLSDAEIAEEIEKVQFGVPFGTCAQLAVQSINPLLVAMGLAKAGCGLK